MCAQVDAPLVEPPHSYTHSKMPQFSIKYSDAEMKAEAPTEEMATLNHGLAEARFDRPLCQLVTATDATDDCRRAAAALEALLNSPSFDSDDDGIRWESDGCKRLSVGAGVSVGFAEYGLVDAQIGSKEQGEQSENVLRAQRKALEQMTKKRDQLAKKGLGMAQLEQLRSEGRIGAAAVIGWVYLRDQGRREVEKLYGSCGDEVDSHCPNSKHGSAAFGWHPDNHAELDAKSGPYIEYAAVCQLSEGQTSMAVAGFGELEYKGPGSFSIFPACMLHRTMRRGDGKAMWKMAIFFEP